jgi:hypothetical protein
VDVVGFVPPYFVTLRVEQDDLRAQRWRDKVNTGSAIPGNGGEQNGKGDAVKSGVPRQERNISADFLVIIHCGSDDNGFDVFLSAVTLKKSFDSENMSSFFLF